MSEKLVPCLHCAIIGTINAHVHNNNLQVAPGSEEAFKLHGEITADVMNVIRQHIDDDAMLDRATRREMWRVVTKWAFSHLLEHATVQDIVDTLTAKAAEATVKH